MTASTVEDRRMLAEAVRDAASGGPREFLADGDRRAGFDESLWRVLTEQIGVGGLLVPEELGGAGAGFSDVSVVLGELAAALAPVPALSSVAMATAVLRTVGEGASNRSLLEDLASGATVATVAWPDAASADATPRLALTDGVLTGRADFVLDAERADLVLLPVRGEVDTVWVAVALDQVGVQVETYESLDLTRSLTAVAFDGAGAQVVSDSGDVDRAGQVVVDIALVAASAEQVGIADHGLNAALEWARDRVQFDRPIGSFQAIKHLLVDLLQDVELARSALDVGTEAVDAYFSEPSEETAAALRIAASAAKAMCGDAAMRVANESLHVLGGIGFTWEHDAHLYFRRAKTLELLLGSPDAHRARLAAAWGLGA